MNNFLQFLLAFLFTTSLIFSQSNCTPIPEVNFPGGRVVMSFDGNVHDDDDIVAMAYSAGLWWAAGLQDKVVQIEYNNHVCAINKVETDGVGPGKGYDGNNMRTTASGTISNFGYNASIFYDFERVANASTNKMASEIEKSTAANPLWIIAAGPMETVWRGLEKASKGHNNVTVISHSKWNQEHAHCSDDHNWIDLKNKYRSKGVFFVEDCTNGTGNCGSATGLNNQNGGFSSAISNWTWMRDSAKGYNRWIFSRNPFGKKFDPSDAGMSYFLITGGPFNGGNKAPDHNDARKLMENPCTTQSTPPPSPTPTPTAFNIVSPIDGRNFKKGSTITINVASTGSPIAKHKIFVNNKLVDVDMANFTPHKIKNAQPGSYSIKVQVTGTNGKVSTKTVVVTVGNTDSPVTPPVAVAPDFNFVSPVNGQNLSIGSKIVVRLAPTAKSSRIVKYQIFVNNKLVDTDGVKFTPHNILNASKGTYAIRAKVTDASGKSAVKSVVVNVGGAGKSTNAIALSISPTEGQEFTEGNTVSVDVSAKANNGSIVKYQIFVDGKLVDTDGAKFTTHAIKNITRGDHTINVKVTDSNGNTKSSTSRIVVNEKSSAALVARLDSGKASAAEGSTLNEGTDTALRVAPNPIQGSILHVFQKGTSGLRVVDIFGFIVQEISDAGEEAEINVSGLKPGIYILESDTANTKFVVPN